MEPKRLSETLAKIGISIRPIERIILVKFGCVRLATAGKDEIINEPPITKKRKGRTQSDNVVGSPDQLFDAILESLQKSPNVFDVEVNKGNARKIDLSTQTSSGTIVSNKLFKLRVDLPERLQKYREDRLFSEKPIEEFKVISTGSLYAAYAPVDDYRYLPFFGHEYRVLLRSQIEKETEFKAPVFGPSPIHPGFYIVFRKPEDVESSSSVSIHCHEDEVLIIVDRRMSQKEIDNYIEDIFFDVEPPLHEFYSYKMQDEPIHSDHKKIGCLFDQLSDAVLSINQTKWWSIFKRNGHAAIARDCLLNLHIVTVDFENKKLAQKRYKTNMLNALKENELLGRLFNYFESISDREFNFPQSLTTTVNYFESELDNFRKSQSVVIASIIGAVIGGLLTVLCGLLAAAG